MGGGDLNMKKSWHPLLRVNQERVWKQEKKAYEERKKLDELRRERDQEREMQELQRLQEEAGGKKRVDKVDWMYATPASGNGPSASELEDYLLGKKKVDQYIDQKAKRANEEALSQTGGGDRGPSSSYMAVQQNVNSSSDVAAKIREDPMFAIKQQEQQAYQALLKDPTRLKQMRIAAGLDRADGHSEDRRPKDDRRRRDRHDSSSQRDSKRSKHKDREDRHDRHRSSHSGGKGRYADEHHREKDDRKRMNDKFDGHPSRGYDDRRRDRESYADDDRHSSSYDSRCRDDRGDSRRWDGDRRREHSDHSRVAGSSRARERSGPDGRYRGENSHGRYPDAREQRSEESGSRNGSRRRSQSPNAPRSRSGREDAPSAPRYPPRPSRDAFSPKPRTSEPTSQTSAEDSRAAKLARMQSNARDMNADRSAYLAKVQSEEKAESEREEKAKQRMEKRSHGGQASFLLDQQRKIGVGESGGEAMNLEERLRRGKGGLQKIDRDE
ncbi:unnamed protein product [Sympodiomycopsis kandeliae]